MTINFEKYAQKGNEMLKELAIELGETNINKAGRILKAVLHALRNRITAGESIQLVSQLPMYIKAVYIEGWEINKAYVRIRHLDDFLHEVSNENTNVGYFDFPNSEYLYNSVVSVFRVLIAHVSPGEIEDIKAVMPKELKKIWDEAAIPEAIESCL